MLKRFTPSDLVYIDPAPAKARTDLLAALSAELGYAIDAADPWAVMASCFLPFIIQTRAAADSGIKAGSVAFATGAALDVIGAGAGLQRGGISSARILASIGPRAPLTSSGVEQYPAASFWAEVSATLKKGDQSEDFTYSGALFFEERQKKHDLFLTAKNAGADGNGFGWASGASATATLRDMATGATQTVELTVAGRSDGGESETESDDDYAGRLYRRIYAGGRTGTAGFYEALARSFPEVLDARAMSAQDYNTWLSTRFPNSPDIISAYAVTGADVVVVILGTPAIQRGWRGFTEEWGQIFADLLDAGRVVGQVVAVRPALGWAPLSGTTSLVVTYRLYERDVLERGAQALTESVQAAFDDFVGWQTTAIGRAWSLDELTHRLVAAGAAAVDFSESGDSPPYTEVIEFAPTELCSYVPPVQQDGTTALFTLDYGGMV